MAAGFASEAFFSALPPTLGEDAPPPIAVELCTADVQSTNNPNLKVGISFRNDTDVTALEVTFDIALTDAAGKILDVQQASIEGKFSSNILIEPRRSPIDGMLLTQPEFPQSPAWNIANHYGSGVERVRCSLDFVKFTDGTTWKRRPPPQSSPQ